MNGPAHTLEPARLLIEHSPHFFDPKLPDPILDLACGNGSNGIFMAGKGLPVICCDRSPEALEHARKLATHHGVTINLWQVDLEQEGINSLREDFYGGILVFRYLHRPLIPCIKKAIKEKGLIVYETYTVEQPRFGKPHRPDFLLNPGELKAWFEDWDVIYHFEGIEDAPQRATAQLVARKPVNRGL